jgi:anti-sigma factor RsiW
MDMNLKHPERQELVGYLYEELDPGRQQEVSGHLSACAECRGHLESWRSVRGELAAWQVARKPLAARAAQSGRTAPSPVFSLGPLPWQFAKLAAAAVVLIGIGFGLARWSTPAATVDPAALREAVVKELRDDLRAELGRFASGQSARQEEYQAALTETLGRLEAQRLAEYANLRKDMETVALRTEGEFQNTRQNLRQLAGLNR